MQHRIFKTEYFAMFILSAIVFGGIDIDGKLYFVVVAAIWAMMWLHYKPSFNLAFYIKGLALAVINFGTYAGIKIISGKYTLHHSLDTCLMVVYAAYLFLSCNRIFIIWRKDRKAVATGKDGSDMSSDSPELYQERRKDVNEIRLYLDRFSSIGIDGVWGSGKTVLMNAVVNDQELKDRYIFITIHLLSVDFDKVQDVIISEIGKALESQGIFSAGVPGLLKWLKADSRTSTFLRLFVPEEDSYTESMRELKKELSHLDGREIVIIYEDIDRVREPDNIRKLFSISENLTSASVKFVYEFDEDSLHDIDKRFDRIFISKYIQHVIRITPVSAKHIYEDVIKRKGFKYLTSKDLQFTFLPIYVDFRLRKALETQESLQFTLPSESVRETEIFLEEIEAAFESDGVYREEKNRRSVIAFFVMKHYSYDLYKSIDFNAGGSLIDQIRFRTDDEHTATARELLRAAEAEERLKSKNPPIDDKDDEDIDTKVLTETKRKGLWDDDENRLKLLIISMFGYSFDVEEIKYRVSLSPIVNESRKNNEKKARNEEIDRIIQSLDFHGKSNITDAKFLVKKMESDVFPKLREEWHDAFAELSGDFFAERYDYEGNHTFFRLGISYMIQLFKAFDAAHADGEGWKNLVSFYFDEVRRDTDEGIVIWEGLLQPLNFLNTNCGDAYFEVLKEFNKASIVGNMNKSLTYRNFLQAYIGAMSGLSYIETFDEVDFLRAFPDFNGIEEFVFDPLRKKLEKLKENLSFSKEVSVNINMMIKFIEKNAVICSMEKVAPKAPDTPRVKSTVTSKLQHQDVVDKILKECKDEDSLKESMVKEYEAGKLTPYEMDKAMKMYRGMK